MLWIGILFIYQQVTGFMPNLKTFQKLTTSIKSMKKPINDEESDDMPKIEKNRG